MPDRAQSAAPAAVPTAAGAGSDTSGSAAIAWLAAIAGWLVPGLGHALLRKWTRAVVYFLAVAAMVVIGVKMHGTIFSSETAADTFDYLGYFANLGTGIFYFIARPIAAGMADAAHATGDYGTRFLAAAGVLNLLFVAEAFEIARRRKS